MISMSDKHITPQLSAGRLLSYDQALGCSPIEDLCSSTATAKLTLKLIACNLVIIGYLSLATIVGVAELPMVPDKDKANLISAGAPLGMRQAWRVFSPQLRSENFHTLCLIEFQDGTIKAVEFPRMQKLSLIERFIHEKQRNVLGDRILNPYYKRFRPIIARYYSRANFSNANEVGNPPVRLTFVIVSAGIPPIKSGHWIYRDQLPEHTFKQVYFSYQVSPADLTD